jgi:hypothetical protein
LIQSTPTRTRWAAIPLAALFLFSIPVAALPADTCGSVNATGVIPPVQTRPDLLWHETIAIEKNQKYEALLAVYSESDLAELDELFGEYDMILDPLDPPDYGTVEKPEDEDSMYDDLLVAEEISDTSGEVANILKTAVGFAADSAPVLHTLVRMRENSHHEDFWSFYIEVEVLNSCGLVLGSTEQMNTLQDNRGKTDRYHGFLELPLLDATTAISEISIINVLVHTEVCRYGWFSGKLYGCSPGTDIGEIAVTIYP